MSANNISGAVNTNNITYKNTTNTKPAPVPQETPKKETDNSKKLLLALGGLAAIGVAAYLITHGKKDKVKDIAEDTLPQAANSAKNAGKASDKLKEGAKDAAKKAGSKKDAAKKMANKKDGAKKTAKAAGKNPPANKPAAPAPQPELSAAEKMKNFTGEKTITKKDGTKVVAKFEKGKPTESIFTHPDGTYTMKMYEYDEKGKLSSVANCKIAENTDDVTIGKMLIHTEDSTAIFNGETNAAEKIIFTDKNEPLDFGANLAIFEHDNSSKDMYAGIVKYYKDGKAIATEALDQENFATKIPEAYANIKLKSASK